MITVNFKDFNEMVAFSKELLGVDEETPKKEKLSDKKIQKTEVVKEGPEPVEVKEEPEIEEETKQTTLTIEDIREVFVEKNNAKGNTAKLKEILVEFGVKKVTDLEEKDFDTVMAKLKEL